MQKDTLTLDVGWCIGCTVVYGGVIIQVLDSCGGIGVTAPIGIVECGARAGGGG